ncbi:MAG: hypothetical protein VYA30_12245 [Myxococcota bacterium]|nr:hypothetical protein [Myxococcota bacterium]
MRLVLLICSLLCCLPAHANDQAEIDHLALATVMLQDGYLKRAAAALEQVDKTDETLDQVRYYTVSAVLNMRLKRFELALKNFDKIIELGKASDDIHLSRARCAYALNQCETVEAALDAAGDKAWTDPDFLIIRSECAWTLKDYDRALHVLSRAQTLFPEQRDFGRKNIQRLIELGLYQSAADVGLNFVKAADSTADDVLFLAEALLKAKESKSAIRVLEKAMLTYPDDNRIKAQAAHAWLSAGYPVTAARQFLNASEKEEKYARDAAEIYRELGSGHKALAANGRILEQTTKLKQRLAILLDLERFEAVTALAPRLSRLDILGQDEELRYALAYAYFRTRDFKKTERHLKRLTNPSLFNRAAKLRKAMADCRRDKTLCD